MHSGNLKFGPEDGTIYPVVWRFLNLIRSPTPSKWKCLETPAATDRYLMFCWTFEIASLIALSFWSHHAATVVVSILFIIRIYDMLLTQLSVLIGPKKWSSTRRIILLILLNALELILIYGSLYWTFLHIFPNLSCFNFNPKNLSQNMQ